MGELTDDITVLKKWIGRSEVSTQVLNPRSADHMCMLLDRDCQFNQGDKLPLLWHWLYFIEASRHSELGYDGHPKLGSFLPPVSLPRRMWASGDLQFSKALKIGDEVIRNSIIEDIQIKQGKSGKLCFVKVKHTYHANQKECFSEIHNIVYRDKSSLERTSTQSIDLPRDFEWTTDITPDPVMLFRYSALTFNGHRIHYDRDFCTKTEGYPGLVFHGPLTATLLLDQAISRYPGIRIKGYRFKAISPIFDIDQINLFGKKTDSSIELWAATNNQRLAMQAELRF